jgi:Fe2+ transport system protein FeoA
MLLTEAKLNTNLIVKNIALQDADKLRLLELGLTRNIKIIVKHKSLKGNNLLIIFENSCFVLGYDLAKYIEVNYA